MGVEIEMYLLGPDNQPLSTGVHCYSLQKANDLEPAASDILLGLGDFVRLEGGNVEYGPGQWEVNLAHDEALAAADQGVRLKYGVREMARREGVKATFMAKPFNKLSGSSMHLHVSLWKDGEPAFAPGERLREPAHAAARSAASSGTCPGIALYGSPTVNSYKRFELDSFAPVNVSWGGDNRTVSIRSLIESPNATRIELRTPASDANPYWAAAATADRDRGRHRGRRRSRQARRGLPVRRRRRAAARRSATRCSPPGPTRGSSSCSASRPSTTCCCCRRRSGRRSRPRSRPGTSTATSGAI